MLEQVDFSQGKLDKEKYKERRDALVDKLVLLQQRAVREGIGMVVLFEGWNGAGKGSRISDLLYNLDARATSVHVTENVSAGDMRKLYQVNPDLEGYYPLMAEFWESLGERGSFTFYDCGWYTACVRRLTYERVFGRADRYYTEAEFRKRERRLVSQYMKTTRSFEKQVTDDGYEMIKFFVHVSQKKQEGRLKKLARNPETAWRIDSEDVLNLTDYDSKYHMYDQMLDWCNYDFAPWTLVNGEDKRRANLTVLETMVDVLERRLSRPDDKEAKKAQERAKANSAGIATTTLGDERTRTPEQQAEVEKENERIARKQHKAAPKTTTFSICSELPQLGVFDDTQVLEHDEYKRQLNKQQERMAKIEPLLYRNRIPLIVLYEGWDAAGKGGNIKRLAQALDARAYTIFPSKAPTKPELAHPTLWRYWTRLPKAGHVGIYDRTWYGRVLVERIEGFASPKEWGRAYDEINEFERDLVDWGAIIIKFWVDVSREEQLARFGAREQNPEKRWKITDEDWRNRDKYPQYREAVEDMFRLTSTELVPWRILESNNKYYARVKALKIIGDAIEQRLETIGF